jgi:hypothetical protein
MQYGMQFKAMGGFPYHDRTLYNEVTRPFVKEALGFSESQLDQLSGAIHASFDELLGDTDPTELLPIDSHRLKTELARFALEDIARIMESSPLQSDEALENWDAFRSCREWGESMFSGVVPTKKYGLNAPDIEKEILADWKEYYALGDGQIELVREPASDYISRAREVLAKYGESEDAITSLPPDLKEKLNADLLALQQQEEHRVGALLSDSQREAVQQQRPSIRQFDYGHTTRTDEPSFFRMLEWLLE